MRYSFSMVEMSHNVIYLHQDKLLYFVSTVSFEDFKS